MAKKASRSSRRQPPVAGINSRNPFYPFALEIIQEKVAPLINLVISEDRPNSMKELLQGYKKRTGSNLSAIVMKAFLRHLGYTYNRAWATPGIVSPPARDPGLIDKTPPAEERENLHGAEFFDPPPVTPTPDPVPVEPRIPTVIVG